MSDLDNQPATTTVADAGAPPPGGDTTGSPPSSVDTTVPPAGDAGEAEKAKQSRREARAFASLRRQISERDIEIGRLRGLSEAGKATPTADTAGPPKQSDYNNFDDYMAAVVAHATKSATENFSKTLDSKRGQETTQKSGQEFWSAAAKEAKDKGIEGFSEAAEAIKSGELVTSPAMSHYVIEEADNKAALVAWLNDNPDESERIASLDPVRAGAALAKVDAAISARPPARQSNAPPPPPTVNGGASPTVDLSKVDMDTYGEHWHARRAKRR